MLYGKFMVSKKNLFNFFSFFLYATLIFGFIIGEDLNGGAKNDFYGIVGVANAFVQNFEYSFFNYEDLRERHSPVIAMIIAELIQAGLEIQIIQLIFLHICLLLIVYFYKSLKIVFSNINSLWLKYLSLIIFLSPTFRALAIWPDSRIIGLLFFTMSLYYFLKFKLTKKEIKYVFANSFFLAVSSYFSPNFCIFSIYFFIEYLIFYKKKKELLYYIILNIFLAMPAFYYLFILDVFFLYSGGTPGANDYLSNYSFISYFSNKILIISSIIFFYLIPIILSKKENIINIELNKYFLILILIFLLNIIFFDYNLELTGGGIFFKFTNIFFNNNYLFYFIAFVSFYFIYQKFMNWNNFFIIFILILSNPQLTIYHKYYDPLLTILFFTIFKINLDKKYFNLRNLSILYLFYSIFIIASVYKVNFIY